VLESVLVANRGEIARRIIRTCRRLGIRSVAVYAAPDTCLPYVGEADHAVELDTPSPRTAYLDADSLLAVASRLTPRRSTQATDSCRRTRRLLRK
jgi:acetyl-CoA carboxylase, biotin carboxylase subunit